MSIQPPWTEPRLKVLRILFDADAPLWALDVARATGMSHGTVYNTFRVLYDRGWAVGDTETTHPGRPARVLYRLTAQGRTEVAKMLSEG
jgi:predicted ArsR family transcriptional regulator